MAANQDYLRLGRLMCGKALPYRNQSKKMSAARLSLAANVRVGTSRKGEAFPHIQRQSRGTFPLPRGYASYAALENDSFDLDCHVAFSTHANL
jgi:hypothetical protein